MFQSDLSEQKSSRRAFLVSGGMLTAAVTIWCLRPVVSPVGSSEPARKPVGVDIAEFSALGVPAGVVHRQTIVKSDAEWRRQLSANAFDIARRADTEMAHTGAYWNLHQKGLYRCVCCATALFSSTTKFDSGTGWPSFWEPIARGNVVEKEDHSWGERTAVACALCDAHLGHVFTDGPRPTGLRYCMNSASLVFAALA